MSEHARLSPSSAARWMACPGSVQLGERFPDETSEYAAEGSVAHLVREKCLLENRDAVEFIGESFSRDGFTFEVDSEMAAFLQPGIDYVREQKGEVFVEQRVSLDAWMPGQFGTLDTGIVGEDEIQIIDLKFGRGVPVSPERNEQMMLYAAGFWENIARHKTKATKFRLIIDQPRGFGGTGGEWVTDLDTILKFAEEAAAAAMLTEDPDAPLQVTLKGCQFCRVASNAACPELHRFCLELVGLPADMELGEVPEMLDIDQLTPERRSYIIQHAGLVKKWLQSIQDLHLQKALAGEPTPGFKAVATLGDRSWIDPKAAEEFWLSKLPKKDVFVSKLKSPAQLEKIAGPRVWAQAQEMIHRPEGKPALVPETDKRPALIPVVNLLDDLDDEEEATLETVDYVDDLI